MTQEQWDRWKTLPDKKYVVTYQMNPRYGGHTINIQMKAPNKTLARLRTIGEYNPGKVLKIAEVH